MDVTFSRALNSSRLEHEKYQMNLGFWDKFIIWSYTLGSATVNRYLMDKWDEEDVRIWAEGFLTTYQETADNKKHNIPDEYKEFMTGSVNYLDLLEMYIENLQRIIRKSPSLTGDIIVYKASTPYPGLEVGDVKQEPFNSTSYRVDINYSTFLPPGGLCCMHKLVLRKGSRALILSPLLSAFPDESEIILPYGVTFRIRKITYMTLNVPNDADIEIKYKTVQERPYSLGPIYLYNYKVECDTVRKRIELYESVVIGN